MLPRSASLVIVGGGVMGASAAFHLAEAGVDDVLLVERAQLASGSTSRAAGGVRAQFSDELNIRLGARSLEAFADFGRRPETWSPRRAHRAREAERRAPLPRRGGTRRSCPCPRRRSRRRRPGTGACGAPYRRMLPLGKRY